MCSLHSLITNRKKFKADPEKNIKNKKRNPVYVFFLLFCHLSVLLLKNYEMEKIDVLGILPDSFLLCSQTCFIGDVNLKNFINKILTLIWISTDQVRDKMQNKMAVWGQPVHMWHAVSGAWHDQPAGSTACPTLACNTNTNQQVITSLVSLLSEQSITTLTKGLTLT